jgi:hypothetical protein
MPIPGAAAAEQPMPDSLQDLQRIAVELAPCSTLLVAPPEHPLTERLAGLSEFRRIDARGLLAEPDELPRQRLGLVAGALEHLPASEGEALLALLRDRLAETLYCLAEPAQWPAARMLALGLRPLGTYPQVGGGMALYHFDFYDYKRTPDWLNPRHWSNPELWDKHRW